MEYYLAIQVLLADYNVAYNAIEAKESIQAWNQLAVNDILGYLWRIFIYNKFNKFSRNILSI